MITFDDAYRAQADALFDSASPLEITRDGGKTWQVMARCQQSELALSDRSHAYALASHSGLKFSDGTAVRFLILGIGELS